MISPQQAKEFFEAHLAQIIAIEPFTQIHVPAVVRTARFLAEVEGLSADEAEAAAWLHDVGYCGGQDGHAERGLELCRAAKLDLTEGIADAILNHGTHKAPATPLGKILRKADKLSFLDDGLLRAAYPKEMQAIKDLLPTILEVL